MQYKKTIRWARLCLAHEQERRIAASVPPRSQALLGDGMVDEENSSLKQARLCLALFDQQKVQRRFSQTGQTKHLMPFDNPTRTKLARLVTNARSLLTTEFTKQLQELYGIQPDGRCTDLDKLTHLDEEQLAIAEQLRERIFHLASGIEDKHPMAVATDRLIREQAFTILNRFAALRLCEERGLVQECVRQGASSKGFKVYLQIAGSALGHTYARYRTFLFCLFDEIAVDLGILFDRFSPYGLLFPREAVLLELLHLINTDELQHIWTEDETIGWIYQYFNSKEERQAMRKASSAPRNSRELAVRNQFFTPRYVVEFLTDNSLGRIWYEMRVGDTRLVNECDYLVRRPAEIFLKKDETAPEQQESDEELSQEELLKQPHYIPFRPKKDPRDILMLDPAGGSGHFGLYCFDLYETIYREAWDDPELPRLQEDYPDKETFERDIPRLILLHNIHIIDIDPRAVQIAALALWLRAQRSWQTMGLKSADRPRIVKTNIVCAEPMPGEKDLLKEFTATLNPPVLGQIVERIFDRMQLAGEAGSLLKIEEDIQESIDEAKAQWQRLYERARDKKGNELLFTESEMDAISQEKQLKMNLFDVSNISDAEFWDTAEERILAALQRYAEQAENGHTLKRRLFAEDAARGFSLIDVSRKFYDVVLMNPPFGSSPENISKIEHNDYLNAILKNIAWGFTERTIMMLNDDGLLGCIIDRTLFQKSSYEAFRNKFIRDIQLNLLLDLGIEILDDADVMTCCFTSLNRKPFGKSIFLDERQTSPEEKSTSINELVNNFKKVRPVQSVFFHSTFDFKNVPFFSYSYWLTKSSIDSAFNNEKIGTSHYNVGGGLQCNDVFRFVRIWPELSPSFILNRTFVSFYNGGPYSCFLIQNHQYVYWEEDGRDIKAKIIYQMGDHPSRYVANESMYFNGGIAGGKRGEFFDVHILPKAAIFSNEGRAFQKSNKTDVLILLSFLNTAFAQNLVNTFCGQHKGAGYLRQIPLPKFSRDQRKHLVNIANSIIALKRNWLTFDETGLEYQSIIPNFKSGAVNTLSNISEIYRKQLLDDEINLQKLENNIRNVLIDSIGRNLVEEYENSGWTESARPKDRIRNMTDLLSNIDESFWLTKAILSALLGMIFGRWDIRVQINASLGANLADPFDSLPMCPPGMVIAKNGLEASTGQIVSEEWLRARPDANTLPPEGSVKNPTISDDEYPIRISWDGILVDDALATEGHEHQEDIIRRIREVLDVLWGQRAAAIEAEACEILGLTSLRDYFRRPTGFFQDHLKRYSKSRRQAPIYWPLSSVNGNYTLWVYYHRLNDQFLFTCVNDYVDPRLAEVRADLDRLHKQYEREQSSALLRQLETLQDFETELTDFRDELLRVAHLPYKPNLNDGVLITAAPLWQLFRLPKWRKNLQECWDKLEAGDYDWAHLAYSIWPERVREVCKKDKSIAIAHDLERQTPGS